MIWRIRWNMFILSFFVFSLFCNYALATPALVVGDIESLPLLTYTSYLEGHPVLFFTQQLSAEDVARLLQKNKNIVFFESNFMDLVLSTVKSSYRYKIPDKDQPFFLTVKNEDTYEVWGMKKENVKKIMLDGRRVKEEKEDKDEGITSKRLIKEKLKKGEHKMGESLEKKKWLFNSLNTDYRLFPSEGLVLFAYFNRDSEEDEFVEIKGEEMRVDLERYPNSKLVYSINDADVVDNRYYCWDRVYR